MTFICYHCGREFNTYSELTEHYRTAHKRVIGACDGCFKASRSNADLFFHTTSKHGPDSHDLNNL